MLKKRIKQEKRSYKGSEKLIRVGLIIKMDTLAKLSHHL